MKLGFVSDAHGNSFGLQKCISELRERVERIYFLGDAVGYFPLAQEVFSLLQQNNVACQLGNHDAMLCGLLSLDSSKDRVYGLGSLREELDPGVIAEISRWPKRRELEIDGCRLLLVHGSPRDELSEYVYPDSDLDCLSSADADAVFMGHTHIPFIRRTNSTLAVNVGSCGLPRDIGNMASCSIFDTQSGNAEILRFAFDTAQLLAASQPRGKVADQVLRCLERRRLEKHYGEPHE